MSAATSASTVAGERVVMVSGCYDILHAGHVQFFSEARALGDRLVVSFASADVLYLHKQRRPSIPDEHKKVLLEALRMVDEVVVGCGHTRGLDFEEHFLRIKPQLLVVTTDDKYEAEKRALCARVGCQYTVLPKTPPRFAPVSTTSILRAIRAPDELPLRVDFAGGWLDVPKFAVPGAFVVNLAIEPRVSLASWPYERNAGLGGSAAWAMLNGRDGVGAELDLGVGWQVRRDARRDEISLLHCIAADCVASLRRERQSNVVCVDSCRAHAHATQTHNTTHTQHATHTHTRSSRIRPSLARVVCARGARVRDRSST